MKINYGLLLISNNINNIDYVSFEWKSNTLTFMTFKINKNTIIISKDDPYMLPDWHFD